MVHRINVFLLSLILIFSQILSMNSVLASSTTGGWNVGSAVAQGATTVYTATKDVGGKVVTGIARITPTPAQIAKGLSKGLFGGLALSVAQKLIEDGVDFVLDPANNSIRYNKKHPSRSCAVTSECGSIDRYLFRRPPSVMTYYTSVDSACSAVASSFNQTFVSAQKNYDSDGIVNGALCKTKTSSGSSDQWSLQYDLNSVYDSAKDDTKQSIPFSQLASSIIGEANNNDEDAKAITSAVAQSATASNTDDQLVPYTQLTQALDASIPASQDDTKSPPTTNTNTNTGSQSQTQDQSKPDESASSPTATPTTKSFELPAFCGWAPQVCEAAQVVINFPNTVTEWWKTGSKAVSDSWAEFKDWMTKDETPERETNVDIEEKVPEVKNTQYLQWGEYCPFSPGSQTISLENTTASIDYDLTSWCKLASDLRPFVLVIGALMSFLIASGVFMGRGDE